MMENKCKRFLSLLLAFVMVLGMFPAGHAHAASAPVSGKTYLIVNVRSGKLLTSSPTDASDGLLLDGTPADTAEATLWTIEGSDGSYTVKDPDGKYLTVSNENAAVSSEAVTVAIGVNGSTWTINQDGYYLNQFGGGSSTRAAGWKDNTAAGDPGSQWALYEYVPVNLQTGETHEVTVGGNFETVVGNETVSVNAVFAQDMLQKPAAAPATEIESDAEYYIYSVRAGKYVTDIEAVSTGNSRGAKGLAMVNTASEAAAWTVADNGDGTYTISTEKGAISVNGGNDVTLEDEAKVDLHEGLDKYHADGWEIRKPGTNCGMNHFESFGDGTSTGHAASAFASDDDKGNQWLLYKAEMVPAVSYTTVKATHAEGLESGKSYLIVNANNSANVLVSTKRGDNLSVSSGASVSSFDSTAIWTLDGTVGDDGAFEGKVMAGENQCLIFGDGGNSRLVEDASIRIERGSKFTDAWRVKNNGTFLNPQNGEAKTYNDPNDNGNHWHLYEVIAEPVGSTKIVFTAAKVGNTNITVGNTIYHFEVTEKHVHRYTQQVTTTATCKVEGIVTYTCSCNDSYTENIGLDPTNHVNTTEVTGTPATLNAPGIADSVYCNDCKKTVSGGDPIAQLTVKNAQPMMDSWNSGIVSLDDCLYTLSGTEGAYSLDHGGSYYVRPGANSTTGRPQQNEPFAGLTLQIVDGKLRISADANHLHVHLAGTAHTDPGTHPWWDKCDKYHADAGNGSHDFYLLKANANSTFAGVPGYEVVTSLENAVGGSYLIAFTNKTGEWFVMYPSTETVSLAKVVTDAVTHTHNYTDETVTKDPTCAETGLKDLKCSCGHFHAEHKNVEIPATGEHSYTNECDTNCKVCGQNTRPGATHVSDAAYDCVAGKCQYCETPMEAAAAHTPAADDGDCTTAIDCSVCGQEATAAKSHAWAESGTYTEPTFEADGYTTYNCTNSGCTKTNAVTHVGTKKVAVAEANGVKYATLAEAIAVGGEVTLLADVELTERLDISGTVSLKLNGHTISGDFVDAFGMIYVKKGAELSLVGDGSIIAEKTHAIGNYGYVSVEGGNIVSNADETYAGLYNFYYQADYYGSADIFDGGSVDSVFNCGNLKVYGGHVAYVDNSGHLAVLLCEVNEIYARDGSDAPGVIGAGEIFIAYPENITNITVPEGFKLVKIGKDTYQVVAKTYVAELNGTEYETLAEALGFAQSGDTVKLLADSENETNIPDGAVLDLNGHKLYLTQTPFTGCISINGGKIMFGDAETMGSSSKAIRTTDGVLILADNGGILSGGTFTFVGESLTATVAGTAKLVVESSEIDDFNVSLDSTEASIVGPEGLNVTTTQDGYEVVYENGTYTLAEKAPVVTNVAMIGERGYATLAAAIAAVNAGETILLVADVTEEIQISDNAVVDLDLNGKTLNGCFKPFKGNLTVKNGSIVNTNSNYSAIEINAGELVLNNVNVISARHAVRIDGSVTATIDGGEYKINATKGTRHALNVSGAAVVTIKAGTFVGPKGTTMDSGSAVIAQTGAKVIIEGGNFSGGKLNTLGGAGTITVCGGTFDQNPTARLAEGYCVKAVNGVYTVQAHNYKAAVTEPTCEDDGYTTYTCEFCGHSYTVVDEDSALGHTWNEGVVTKAATCNAKGEKTFTCTKCGGTKTEEIPVDPDAHSWANIPFTGEPATCVEAGYNYKICTNCKDTKQDTIPPLGHTFERVGGAWTETCGECGAPNDEYVDNVAQIGEQGYATLAAAISAANAGDTITFLADITEDVTVNKAVTIDGAGKTYTGKMTLKANTTIKNVNFDGKGYNGYAVETRGADYVTIEDCTAKNYGYGFVQLVSATVLTTVKNVTVSNMNYGVKIDYSNAVVLENVDITANVAAVLNSNYGSKPITIKNSSLNILGTWTRNPSTQTTYTFEGANSIDNFLTDAAIDNFKLAAGATLTAPQDITVTTDVENYEVVYENGTYKLAEKKVAVAVIGEQGYETLADAIAAAKAGNTITFVADITENVTINKSVTIDGAGKTYTGTMTGNKGLTITIENVNFVNGGFDKPKAQNSATGNYTIKNCTFVDDGNFGYAVRIYGANKLVVEDCTVSGYKWSFLYVVKGTNTVSVKNVTVENCPTYAVYFASGVNNATFENLTVKNSDNGFVINNTANRSFTIKDCKMENVGTAINYSSGTKAITCTAQGNNDFGTAVLSEYAKVVLTENATLTAPERLNVTTNAGDGYKVIYEEGVYKVVYAPAAMIGEQGYATLGEAFAAAQDGDTIVVMKNIDLAKETPVLLDGSYNTYFKVEGKNVTIDMNGMTISGAYTDSGKMLVGVFSTDNGGHLTVTGNGTVNVTATAKVYCLFANYEPGCSITIENGAYTLDKASDSLLYSGCDKGITVNGGTFILGNVGTGTNGKPWIINCLGGNDNATVVNGGTFNSDISHQFWANEVSIPADLALKNNGDGTWSFVEAVACAEEKATSTGAAVRKVGYATLQEAIDAAANGKTVTLLKDIELGADDVKAIPGNLTAMINVAGKSLTLDMNGKTITAAYDASELLYTVIYVGDGASLTVKGEGKIDLITGDTKAGKYDCVAYMFLKSGDTGALNIENGTFTANKVEDSMIYTNGDKVVNIKGGNWTLGNVGTKTNGAPWIFNTKGQNERTILVSGGTYNFNVAKQYYACEVSIVDANGNLSYVVDNGNGTWTVTGQTAEVAIVTDTWKSSYLYGYATFKDAVASIAKGAAETTIVLQKDITVKGQFIGHSYAQKVVIDLNGYTMSSTDKTLTVYRAGTEVTVKNGTVHGNTTGGTIQVTYGGKLTLGENVTIKSGGSATALKVDANSTLIVDQDTTYVLGGKNDLVVANGAKVQISAGYFKKPVQQAWCAEGYVPTDKLENGYYSVMKDPSIGMEAKIGDTYFESLQAAIEAAQDGDVIVVVNDITVDTTAAVMNSGEYAAIYNVAEKAITIDLNGKKIEVTANAADLESYKSGILLGVFCVDNNGELTLTGNGTVTANAVDASLTSDDSHLYSLMVAYGAGSKLTVENGTFHANSVSSALVYSQYDEIVTINGGTYTLGNLGTDSNGSPWLFNAKGQNERNILVNGGTFSADIQHQYYPFEVQMVKELALSKGEDGMYTVVPAVAYVNEQEWSSAWYTNYVGYATVEEAMAASEGVKTVVSGKKTYTSEQENVYVLASELGDVVIPAEFTGSLVLDNCTVKSITNNSATAKIVVNGNVVVENDNGSAITGEIVNISGTGTLTAIANGEHAYGIGGDATKSITIENVLILDVKGGYVQPDFVYDTKYGKSEPEGGAAIGSGFDGAVITLTNVTIDNAQGGSKAAGIGARYHTGVVINITDCTIKNVEGGNASAGIGGSRVSSGRGESGTTINILNSTITAKGGQAGAGIGSGYDTHCQAGQPICTINIDGSTINAVGGKYAAGVGTGYHNAGLAGEIKNSTVNAASGEKFYKDTYTQAMDIGFGVVDPAREARENNSSITFNGDVIAIPAT